MKFKCKFCGKSYSCGKALGGHLSSHKMAMDCDVDSYAAADDDGSHFDACDDADDDDALGYYGLGKTVQGSGTMLDNSAVTVSCVGNKAHNHHLHHHVCKECGKGFRSLKALCGHMACHSEKERRSRFESQVKDKQRRLFVDDAAADCSETADSGQMQQPCRRSKRVRFTNRARAAAAEFADGFSFISGMMPVEEVASCLMMMSNDRRFMGCWGRGADYSGSPSVESEDKPLSSDDISYEPKQGYKNLDAFNGGYTKRIKYGIAMATGEDDAAFLQEKKCGAKKRESRHECPICNRVFKSGQAMGGHKRSHFLGGVEEAASSSVVVTEKEVQVIDLNFPALEEEGDRGANSIYPW